MTETEFSNLVPGDLIRNIEWDHAYEGHFKTGDVLEVINVQDYYGPNVFVKAKPGHRCDKTQDQKIVVPDVPWCGAWVSNSKFEKVEHVEPITSEELDKAVPLPSHADLIKELGL